MTDKRILPLVVVGASAGGVEALRRVVGGLPADFAAAVCIVLHVPASTPSMLPSILMRVGRLPVRHAADGDALQPGVVLVAPPDRHLIVNDDGTVELSAAPRENRQRPSVDALFRTAARACGPATIGVVLSGSLDDGTAGLAAIKAGGGTAIVQSPGDAAVPEMPRSALDAVAVDYAVPAADLAPLLVRLIREQDPVEAAGPFVPDTAHDDPGDPPAGPPSAFTCPDCHGSLWETTEQGILRYRCRIGHAYSSQSLVASQDDSVERALWAALRSLEEHAALSRRLGDDAERRGHQHSATLFRQRQQSANDHARVLQDVLNRQFVTADIAEE